MDGELEFNREDLENVAIALRAASNPNTTRGKRYTQISEEIERQIAKSRSVEQKLEERGGVLRWKLEAVGYWIREEIQA